MQICTVRLAIFAIACMGGCAAQSNALAIKVRQDHQGGGGMHGLSPTVSDQITPKIQGPCK